MVRQRGALPISQRRRADEARADGQALVCGSACSRISRSKVAEAIKESACIQQGLEDSIEDVLVPKEEVMEIRRGKKVQDERRFMPGYVLVRMEMTDEAYHLIKIDPAASPGSSARRASRARCATRKSRGCCTRSRKAPLSAAAPEIIFEIGEEVPRHRRPVRGLSSASVEEVDEERAPEGHGLDLRPGDAGRAGIRAGREGDEA